MKDSHHGIKARYRLLLFVLLISVMGGFFTLYNQSYLAISGGKLFLALLFAVVAMASGVVVYFALLRTMDKLAQSHSRVSSLEKELHDLKFSKAIEDQELAEEGDSVVLQEAEKVVANLLSVDKVDDINIFLEQLLIRIGKQFEVVQGVAHIKMADNHFHMAAGYAYYSETEVEPFIEGETLAGQAAKNRSIVNLQNIPEGYLSVLSGLGKGEPSHLLIIPIVNGDETIAIIELASFVRFDEFEIMVFEKLRQLLVEHMLKLNSSL